MIRSRFHGWERRGGRGHTRSESCSSIWGAPPTWPRSSRFCITFSPTGRSSRCPGERSASVSWRGSSHAARGRKARRNYGSIGGGSPFSTLTRRQASALEAALNAPATGEGELPSGSGFGSPCATGPRRRKGVGGDGAGGHPPGHRPHPLPAVLRRHHRVESERARAGAPGVWDSWTVRRRLQITAIDRYAGHPGYLEAVAATVRRKRCVPCRRKREARPSSSSAPMACPSASSRRAIPTRMRSRSPAMGCCASFASAGSPIPGGSATRAAPVP